MAYLWVSQATRNTTVQQVGDAIPLTSVSSNEKLRRVILEFYIDLVYQSNDDIIGWEQTGVLSLVEVTTGNPPPIPDPIGDDQYETRNIVYSRFDTVGNPANHTNWRRVPGSLDAARIDVEISRNPTTGPLIVWWNWGRPGTAGGGLPLGFWRCWSRCLLETTP